MRNKRRLCKHLLTAIVVLWATVYVLSYVRAFSDSKLDRSAKSDDYLDPDIVDYYPAASLERKNKDEFHAQGNNDHLNGRVLGEPFTNRSSGKTLILSMERAGSSFIGEILHRLPGVYYSVDPLYFLQFGIPNNTFIQDFLLGKNVTFYLENILRCNFKPLIAASERYFPKENASREELLRKVFPNKDSLEHAMSTCANKSKMVTKVTNVRYIKDVMSLLDDPLTSIIYVVRDPRGIMNSVIKADNVNHHGELYYNETINLRQKIKSICDPLLANLNYLKMSYFKKDYTKSTKSLLLLRFEDVAYQPWDFTKKLFKYFGSEPNQATSEWIVNITTSSAYSRNPYSTVRNSSSVPEAWREGLTFEQIKVIQEECTHVLWELGYWAVRNTKVLKNKRKSIVDVLPKQFQQF